jgi:TrmH family RNA methyltransferase
MLSNAQIKLIRSLEQKKYRNINSLYIAEGEKIVAEILQGNYNFDKVYVTEEWLNNHYDLYQQKQELITVISPKELEKISLLKTPNQALALLPVVYTSLHNANFNKQLNIVLDSIQDPGNMGTIMRIADWFGINNIICSENCVDVYNPKVIQATMGAFLRVNVFYTELKSFFENDKPQGMKVYGALLNGENIYTANLAQDGFILLGNESKGVDERLATYIDSTILIPKFGNAESLNVSVAAGIICSEFARRK